MGGGTPETRHILVVDDDPSVRDVLAGYFRQQYSGRGFQVETASNGADAVEAARRRHPALVLLDIEMPGLDGVQALKQIRAIDPRIPVIMVTGNESTQVAGEVIGSGALSYLPKPVRFQYLDHLVASVLGPGG